MSKRKAHRAGVGVQLGHTADRHGGLVVNMADHLLRPRLGKQRHGWCTIGPMVLAQRLGRLFRNPHFWVVAAGLALVTWLHYTTSPLLFGLHTVYRYLYFLPIVYAAVQFGLWGGVLAGVAASLLFAPHIWLKFGAFPEESLNDLFVTVVLISVGAVTGALADAERRQ